jgi:hypothetical protein
MQKIRGNGGIYMCATGNVVGELECGSRSSCGPSPGISCRPKMLTSSREHFIQNTPSYHPSDMVEAPWGMRGGLLCYLTVARCSRPCNPRSRKLDIEHSMPSNKTIQSILNGHVVNVLVELAAPRYAI